MLIATGKRSNTVFQGASAINLDVKGRMTIPSKHRDALAVQCEGRVTLTRHPHGCLLFFPRPTWESHREQIAACRHRPRGNLFAMAFPGRAWVVILKSEMPPSWPRVNRKLWPRACPMY